ncbi:MAG: PUR family DNA/RNA-binding protein [candidate division Zixibacteria bacterium]|nr:PUR family DNA/RNA-binding protein [candidate division Zixibacteria bacterium]
MPSKSEILSEKVNAGKRTYFIDVKLTSNGDKYLKISESRPEKGKSFKHDRVIVFEDNIKKFAEALTKAFRFIGVKGKDYESEEIRKSYPNAYTKWTLEEDNLLIETFRKDSRKIATELAKTLGRQPSAILSRLNKLDLNQELT